MQPQPKASFSFTNFTLTFRQLSWVSKYIHVYFALGSASSQVMLPDFETQSLFCYSMRVSVTLSQKI